MNGKKLLRIIMFVLVFFAGAIAGKLFAEQNITILKCEERTSKTEILPIITVKSEKPLPSYDDGKININTADAAQLCELPKIGAVVAKRIVDYREDNGRFKAIDEIMAVKGIGESAFSQLEDLIKVE